MADKKVTVLLLTYNHRPYFQKAIESVLSQKTSFDFVIHVYDDASTDGTTDLVLQYANKYPDKVKAFVNKENQKGQHIFNALKQIQTPYFAMLETDDYWTDNTKLEQQFQILEKHPQCSICGHNTSICYFDGSEDKAMFSKKEGVYSFSCKKLSQLPKIHVSSRMVRTDALNDIDSFSPQMLLWDEPAFFFFLSKGNLYYIDNIMSVYNYSGKGLFSGSDKVLKNVLSWNMLLLANKELKYKYNRLFVKRLKNKMKFSFITYLKLAFFTRKENLSEAYTRLYKIFFDEVKSQKADVDLLDNFIQLFGDEK